MNYTGRVHAKFREIYTMNNKQPNTKKTSSSAIIVIIITIMIAVFAGSSDAAEFNLEKVLKHRVTTEKSTLFF